MHGSHVSCFQPVHTDNLDNPDLVKQAVKIHPRCEAHFICGPRRTEAEHHQPGFGGSKAGIATSLRALGAELRQKVQQVSHAYNAVVVQIGKAHVFGQALLQ